MTLVPVVVYAGVCDRLDLICHVTFVLRWCIIKGLVGFLRAYGFDRFCVFGLVGWVEDSAQSQTMRNWSQQNDSTD
jgi:hypothetical protein